MKVSFWFKRKKWMPKEFSWQKRRIVCRGTILLSERGRFKEEEMQPATDVLGNSSIILRTLLILKFIPLRSNITYFHLF